MFLLQVWQTWISVSLGPVERSLAIKRLVITIKMIKTKCLETYQLYYISCYSLINVVKKIEGIEPYHSLLPCRENFWPRRYICMPCWHRACDDPFVHLNAFHPVECTLNRRLHCETVLFEVCWTQTRVFVHRFREINSMSLHKTDPLCSNNRLSRKLVHSYVFCVGVVLTALAIWEASDATSSTPLSLPFFRHVDFEWS